MTAPSFPLVGKQKTTPGTAVTLALTITGDPDNLQPGDLHLLNGQLHFWDGANARYQKCLALLQWFKGEWFLNTEEGIPYFQTIFKKGTEDRVVLSIFRKALLLAPKAVAVPLLSMTRDPVARSARIDFRVEFDDGTAASSADFRPFIIKEDV